MKNSPFLNLNFFALWCT